ncbi:MAG TPA: YggT family protein [Jatrophihabitans sp.]|nr:YggT family protein [Jatrophihabitans sp.]
MGAFWAAVSLALRVFYLLIVARLIVETTRTFARSWRPAGAAAVALEAVYMVTDPPVKALRRMIPPLRLGGLVFDVSIYVLFLILWVLSLLVDSIASTYGPL